MLKTVVLLNIFVETILHSFQCIHFFSSWVTASLGFQSWTTTASQAQIINHCHQPVCKY